MSGGDLGGIAALGAFHGLNPAMGWLFAVALGLQQGSRRALLSALPPIAAGHAAAVGLTVVVLVQLSTVVSAGALRVGGAALLVAFAGWKVVRSGHVRWVGFRISGWELALWSFLMSSAHGAGLMLLPFLVGSELTGGHGVLGAAGGPAAGAVALHTAAMLATAAVIAVVVFEVIGVDLLGKTWINVDRLWPAVLLVAAGATLVG
jgi:hypothetical protein